MIISFNMNVLNKSTSLRKMNNFGLNEVVRALIWVQETRLSYCELWPEIFEN